MLKVGIVGSTGRVGTLLIDDLKKDSEAQLAGIHVFDKLEKDVPSDVIVTNDMKVLMDSVDVVIDFSAPAATEELLTQVIDNNVRKPLVIATTGFSKHQQNLLIEASKLVPILYSTNMSLGVAVLNKLVSLASKTLSDFDIEIVEQHHRYKVDSPSGTALTLAEHAARARDLDLDKVRVSGRDGDIGARTKDEIGVMSLRGGDIVGRHTVGLYNDGEFIELHHTATARNTFSKGAIKVAKWLVNKEPSLYSINDALGL
ncbi:4-hydroxy-tetrahydrodipicolinate reductase [Malaciobacter canalis]|jgi:4-hydroxy-tetrahydrodipicolinate reductase|uniref:4-hydroxy-tetrahydrodipicolinate reductase n=2 Tax=Malaciobacter TaxID=2321114 RepID=A0AB36ZTL7_9BACT|nr:MULTISPECIES: 4-hydroxy-tetrahydrodipicolinate reductase [Malaciobacter]PHO08832.1 4-hydroxy-tetrahydrodipicolinate reductase [Malaciobacter canalis]PPK59631.1 dihydrodipicolinate reductase [Malaciobacter marinus]QEE31867.1 4-hydroxy-tetrahydrodipicolinate reductase [Malaciobacter canalis]SKB70930.1 dihydrodipicolinate reductase [Malaciobacter marinus]